VFLLVANADLWTWHAQVRDFRKGFAMKGIFKSRKFYALLAGLLFVIIGERAGVSLDQLVSAVSVIIAYILGVALEDGLRARAG